MSEHKERVRDNQACRQAIHKAAMDWAEQQPDWRGVACLVGSRLWVSDNEETSLLYWGEVRLQKYSEAMVVEVRITTTHQPQVTIKERRVVLGVEEHKERLLRAYAEMGDGTGLETQE